MDDSWQIQALTLAGRVILENGGETYRAEDTIIRMAQALGLSDPEAFCVPSGVFFSFTDDKGARQTSVCRVRTRGIQLAAVDGVNQLSRRLSDGTLEPASLLPELNRLIAEGAQTPGWREPAAAGLTAVGFALMFNGGLWDMLLSGFCAALTYLAPRALLAKGRDRSVVMLLLGSFICTALPLLFFRLTGLGVPEAMIAGAIMPLVPGLSMTNAVQDVMRGDMVSGVAHAAKAILTAALLAGGALMATHLMNLLGGLL